MIPATVLADARRMEQYHQIGNKRRILAKFEVLRDRQGIVWGRRYVGDWNLGFTWFGQGLLFDPYSQQQLDSDCRSARAAMDAAGEADHKQKLREVYSHLKLGGQSQRLLLAIHQRVVQTRQSVVRLPAEWLSRFVWGQNTVDLPRHWRRQLLLRLEGLAWLHLSDVVDGAEIFGRHSALITHVAEIGANGDENQCDSDCPQRGHGNHRHYVVNIGRGFLGLLEEFAYDDVQTGIRTYDFSARAAPGQTSLRSVGKTGRLVSTYLPAILGEPKTCDQFSANQRRLMSAIVRETTRAKKRRRSDTVEPEVVRGNVIPSARGKKQLSCHLLAADGSYTGFNGNKKRKGLGYYLLSPGGWLAKAGYPSGSIQLFLRDLAIIGEPLGLIAVGTDTATNELFDLTRLRALASTHQGRRFLERVNLRLYTTADHLNRWNALFGWESESTTNPYVAQTADLLELLSFKQISRRTLAKGVGVDPSFLSKLFTGKKPWPLALRERTAAWLAAAPTPAPAASQWKRIAAPADCTDALMMALAYRSIGWSVVPQVPGAKKPTVRWKPYQDRLPTEDLIRSWYQRWPTAGVALILGHLSGVLVVDVDGREAHDALVERLGAVPMAPLAYSGSGNPHRYHLFFQHPPLATKPKVTPWHPKLEFRGDRGIVVLPPSDHASGHRYRWADGAGLNDLPLAVLPAAILAALSPPQVENTIVIPAEVGPASLSTRQFLAGNFCEGPGWNDRLFRAACDLQGRGVPLDVAEPQLLAGAKPWNRGEQDLALATIRSAFSQSRLPSRY